MTRKEGWRALVHDLAEEASRRFLPLFYGSMAENCFSDDQRTGKLLQILHETIPPGSEVCDLGAGTGVLGLGAHYAGASHVTLVERSRTLVNFMHRAVDSLGFKRIGRTRYRREGRTVDIVKANALKYVPPRPLDAVLCEMVDTGLLNEQVDRALKRMRPYMKPNGLYYPERADLFLLLCEDSYAEGKSLTDPLRYASIDFARSSEPSIQLHGSLPIKHAGSIDSAKIGTGLTWPGGFYTEVFPTLCSPKILKFSDDFALPEDHIVLPGEHAHVSLHYKFGSSERRVGLVYWGKSAHRFIEGHKRAT